MDSKDAQESLESGGGGGARCRCSNGRRTTTAVLLIQSLLIFACVAFSLSILLNQQHQQPQPPQPSKPPQPIWDNGIFLQLLDSDKMIFTAIWNQTVKLNNERMLSLSCAGPYMVYLWACAKDYNESAANLTLEQGNASFHLQTLRNGECQQMQSVFMLSTKSEVTLKVKRIKDPFGIDRLFLGLHYMLGAQCFHVETAFGYETF